MENAELKKYLGSDVVFNIINFKFISLQDAERKQTMVYLLPILEAVLNKMKSKDTLFNKTYKQITFCGSYYKNTKVGRPNEFDINVVLNLPIDYSTIHFSSTRPAFVKLDVNNSQVYNLSKSNGLTEKEKRSFSNLISNGFLDPNKFRNWIEGIIDKALNELPMSENKRILTISNNGLSFCAALKIKKSGPAFTLKINIFNTDKDIDVDLVPTLKFDITAISKFISNFNQLQQCRNRECHAVPVPVRDKDASLIRDQHWRLSFCLQENEMLKKYGRVKLIIRLMKKLRDTQNWKSLASYYIETLFYNNLTELKPNMNNISATYFFFTMLNMLRDACASHEIRYFWNKDYNLIEKIGRMEMNNIVGRLNVIIRNIEGCIMANKLILATYILNSEELSLLKKIYNSEEHVECTDDGKDEQDPNKWTCVIL